LPNFSGILLNDLQQQQQHHQDPNNKTVVSQANKTSVQQTNVTTNGISPLILKQDSSLNSATSNVLVKQIVTSSSNTPRLLIKQDSLGSINANNSRIYIKPDQLNKMLDNSNSGHHTHARHHIILKQENGGLINVPVTTALLDTSIPNSTKILMQQHHNNALLVNSSHHFIKDANNIIYKNVNNAKPPPPNYAEATKQMKVVMKTKKVLASPSLVKKEPIYATQQQVDDVLEILMKNGGEKTLYKYEKFIYLVI